MLSQLNALTTPLVSSVLADPSVTASAMPETRADTPFAWRAAALAAYELESGVGGAHLRVELAARVHALTGCAIPDGAITADRDARRATAAVDGVVFQLQRHDLILLRPCAHCGTGLFESPPLSSRADLGHALSGWQPYHLGCEPADPPDTAW
ncbi:MAG TPA: hypothetical protein VF818_05030 [Ktedonobacterales bacterium]